MQAALLAVLFSGLSVAGQMPDDPLAQAAVEEKIPPFKPAARSCAEMRAWALEQTHLPSFPAPFEEASAVLTKIQDRLKEANRLSLPGLCPVVLLPMKTLAAKSLPVTFDDGQVFKFVVLTTGMLRRVANDSQLAFVIGHELSHLASGVGESDDPRVFRKRELDADRGGAAYMKLAGFEPWEIPRFFTSYAVTDPRYPSSAERRAAVEPVLGLPPASAPPPGSSTARDQAVALVEAARVAEP